MKRDIPSEDETLIHIAHLFLTTQQTEHSLSSLIGTIYPKEKPSWEEIAVLNKDTLGALIKKLKMRAEMDERFVKLLEVFLEGRNIFVHKLTEQEWFDLHTEQGRDKVWDFLETYQKCLHEIYHIINATILERTEKLEIPEMKNLHNQLKATGYFEVIKSYSDKARIAFKGKKQ